MSHLRSLSPILLVLLFLAGPVALAEKPLETAAPPQGSLTVGDFAVQVARLTLEDPAEREQLTSEEAVASLRRAGLKFDSTSEELLTEEDISEFFRQMGLSLQVDHPQRTVSPAKAGALLSNFSKFVSSRAADPVKGLRTLPTHSVPTLDAPGIEECFINRGPTKDCRECCLSFGVPNKVCGRSCGQARAGKASPVDPTP